MPRPGLAAFIVSFPISIGMSRFIVCVNRSTNRSTQRPTDNRTIAPTDLITNCRASSSTDAATNCRIQCGIRIRVNSQKCKY